MKLAFPLLSAALALLVLPAGLRAAEPAPSPLVGKWAAIFESNRGQIASTYVFKAEGDKLTGTASSSAFTGEGVLSAIKLDKENITFTENFSFDGLPLRFEYTGKLNGDEMKLKRVLPGGNLEQEGVAKRVKEDAPAANPPAVPAETPKAPAPAPAAAK